MTIEITDQSRFPIRDVKEDDKVMVFGGSSGPAAVLASGIGGDAHLSTQLRDNRKTLLLWYANAFGADLWHVANSRHSAGWKNAEARRVIKTQLIDGVLVYSGPDSTAYDDVYTYFPYSISTDDYGLWNYSNWVVFYINSVSSFTNTQGGRYRYTVGGSNTQASFGYQFGSATTITLWAVIGSSIRSYAVDYSLFETQLVDGWNHMSLAVCQDSVDDPFYKLRFYINGQLIHEQDEPNVDALSESGYSASLYNGTTNFRADSDYMPALYWATNQALPPSRQQELFSLFKSENGLS